MAIARSACCVCMPRSEGAFFGRALAANSFFLDRDWNMARISVMSFRFAIFFISLFACVSAYAQKLNLHHADSAFGNAIEYEKVAGTKGTLSLEIVGDKLYALENGGLSIYDISIPATPKFLGSVSGMGHVRQLKVRGKTAFLTARQSGFWAVDVSDPKNPKIISHFDAIEYATGLDVSENFAFIGNRVFGVQCVDISNPAKMRHVSQILTHESQSVYYKDGIVYSGDWGAGEITTIDFGNPLSPKKISVVNLEGMGDGIDIDGGFLYASTGQHRKTGPLELRHGAGHGLEIFDISDIRRPRKISRVDFPHIYFGPCDYWTPRVSGNCCFASDTINGVFALDVSDKKNPKIIGNLILPKVAPDDPSLKFTMLDKSLPQGDPVSSITVGDGVLYIAGTFTGIYIAELPQIAKPRKKTESVAPKLGGAYKANPIDGFDFIAADSSNPVRAVAVRGDLAYVAQADSGVRIFDLSAAGYPQVGGIECKMAYDVKISGGRLVVAEGFGGVGIYDISDAPKKALDGVYCKPREIGRIACEMLGRPQTLHVWAFDKCNVVGVGAGAASVWFFDISNPAKPKKVLRSAGREIVYNDYGSRRLAAGKYFGLNFHCGGRMIFDMSAKPVKRVFSDTYPLCSQNGSVAAIGDKLLTMNRGGYSIDDPAQPMKNSELTPLKFPGGGPLPFVPEGDSAQIRAEFPQGADEGFACFDEKTKRLVVANRASGKVSIYDFSDVENPKRMRSFSVNANPSVADFTTDGRIVLPCGYAGALVERKK